MSTVLDGQYVTVTEAAQELALTTARVRQLIGRGQLKAELAHGRLWVISRGDLDEFKRIDRPPGYHADKRPQVAARRQPKRRT